MIESNSSGIKVIALCKSNADLSKVDFVIPANNEKTKCINYFVSYVSEIIKNILNKLLIILKKRSILIYIALENNKAYILI